MSASASSATVTAFNGTTVNTFRGQCLGAQPLSSLTSPLSPQVNLAISFSHWSYKFEGTITNVPLAGMKQSLSLFGIGGNGAFEVESMRPTVVAVLP